jgi:sterol desaturase/sphingolipid hydroxylase (fatty acid hydroxylase superfamily)
VLQFFQEHAGQLSGFDLHHTRGAILVLATTFIGLEWLYGKLLHDDEAYDGRETAATFLVALGDIVMRILTSAIAAVPFVFLYQHRQFNFDTTLVSMVLLFVGVEFCYYWFHRASHRVRWLWATHSVHHSATRFNLSAAMRLGWTGQLTGAFVFFLPLAWIGFHPLAIAAMLAFGLFYQFFLHLARPISLGPLEWILNSPTHHRVHHASNVNCLDKNYGSVLIVFDRMFGTFTKAPSDEVLEFGLRGQTPSYNPLKIALGEWARIGQDLRKARSWKQKFRVLIDPP